MPTPGQAPLSEQSCVACKPGSPHLSREEIDHRLGQLDGWTIEEAGDHLRLAKVFKFKGFLPGVDLVNRIAAIAEAEQHHPDLLVRYGSVTVWLWTHAAAGITQNDFILAAKIDRLQGA
ncbi:MAG TPA: 4a-hydroxytetrahydrobiopterin dehydratase [Candidatus Acidoferrum sp.]|jgi:4a-hydroxytetrahydrobiopterin dehydratase|nr:4a-hydroxytetrahydrobiopterin dehydratase [Candidatus Acidoferrum sp.]